MGMARPTRAEVYELHAHELIRFATGLAGPDDASDLVSSAMVKAMWSKSWDSVDNHRAYLYRTVLNEARRSYRKSMHRNDAEARAALPTGVASRADQIQPEVLEAVCRLSMRQKAVVVLAYWEDMSVAEIARRLHLSESSVHRYLERAEDRLRRKLYA
jgi:RNA polymerase sigma-70 factor (ECF subfamily)